MPCAICARLIPNLQMKATNQDRYEGRIVIVLNIRTIQYIWAGISPRIPAEHSYKRSGYCIDLAVSYKRKQLVQNVMNEYV